MKTVKNIARGEYRKLMKKARERKANPDKFSSQVEDAVLKARQKAGRAIKNFSSEDLDRKAGEALTSVKKSVKKAEGKISTTAKKFKKTKKTVKEAGKWIGKNKGKSAMIAAAAGGGAYAMNDSDLIEDIKTKDPSERTAAERRLLRLLEE